MGLGADVRLSRRRSLLTADMSHFCGSARDYRMRHPREPDECHKVPTQ